MAKLHFKYGAMNSGKTDTLIKTAYNYTERGLGVIVVKPRIDTKGGDKIITRSGAVRHVDIMVDKSTDIRSEIHDHIGKHELMRLACVLVDEAQLLDPRHIDQLYEIAKLDNISVIAFGLRTDFRTRIFPGSERLFALADNIEKLPTMCSCGSQAEFNCRIADGRYVFDGNQVAIDGDGAVTYEPLCGICYMNARMATLKNTTIARPKKRILNTEIEGK